MIEFVRVATEEEEIYNIVENGVVVGFIKKTDNPTFPWLSQYRHGDHTMQSMGVDLEQSKDLLEGILSGAVVLDDLPKMKMGKQGEDEIHESEVIQ